MYLVALAPAFDKTEPHCTVVGEIGYCIVAVDFRGKKTFVKVRRVEHFSSAARRDFYNFVLVLSGPYIPVLALDEHSMIRKVIEVDDLAVCSSGDLDPLTDMAADGASLIVPAWVRDRTKTELGAIFSVWVITPADEDIRLPTEKLFAKAYLALPVCYSKPCLSVICRCLSLVGILHLPLLKDESCLLEI